jgi:hypothetical protein
MLATKATQYSGLRMKSLRPVLLSTKSTPIYRRAKR